MHPVIRRKLGAVGGKHSVAIAIVLPDNGLHVAAEVAVIVVEVNTEHLAEVARVILSCCRDSFVSSF